MNRFSCLTGIPEMTKGLVRELRVRWMLEELGLPYEEVRYPHPETKKDDYLKKQPFGQVPYFESDDVSMFESGAILLHLALKYGKLLPGKETERAKTLTWLFAGLSSIEPFIFHRFLINQDPTSSESLKAKADETLAGRMRALSRELGDGDYFSGSFSVAEIVMTTVLRNLKVRGALADYPNLLRYVERNESREAFQRALADHYKLYP